MSDVTAVLVTDMEGSTALGDIAGDAAAMVTIREHERLVRTALAAHDGREIKSLGDGFLLAFGSAGDAVRCALDIQRVLTERNAAQPHQPINVRMGVNLGPVIEEAGDLYGTTINAASRIAAKAQRGQVLVSDAVLREADADDWTYVDRGLFWLKGLRERWRLHEATRAPSAATVVSGMRQEPGPFVGRDDERATLRSAVDDAAEGRGSVVLLMGEAGVGKTRLAEEVGTESAGRGLHVFVGRGHEPGLAQPYGPFIEILEAAERAMDAATFRGALGDAAGEVARLLPHLVRHYADVPPPADLPADQARRYLFANLTDVLARIAAPRPLYVLLDDVHWLDEASAQYLEHLALAIVALPIVIVGTCIPSELSTARPMRDAVENLHRRHLARRVPIGPLTADDVRALLAAFAGSPPPDEVVAFLHDETDGNAFFVEEAMRYLASEDRLFDADGAWFTDVRLGDVPDTIRMSVERRVERFAAPTCEVLSTAAALGRDFGFEVLEALHGADEDAIVDALDEAERGGVLVSSTDSGSVRFSFTHDLLRQTLASSVSGARRQTVHADIADALERAYPDALQNHASEIAHHLLEAGRRADPARTVRFLELAGDVALGTGAYEDAFRDFDRALALVGDEPLRRAALLEKLGTAERNLGHVDEALSTWHEALSLYQQGEDIAAVARLCLDAGMQVAWWTRHSDALRLVNRALEVLGDQPSAHRAGLIALQANILGTRGSYAEAQALFDIAVPLARDTHDDRVLGTVLYLKASHHFSYIEHERVVETGTESIAHLRRVGDLWSLANVLGFVSQSLGFLGRFTDADRLTEGARDLAQRLGNWTAFVYIDRARAWTPLSRSPDPDRLVADGGRDLDLGERLGYDWMRAVGYARMAHGSFLRGRWDDALQHANAAAACQAGAVHGHIGRLVLLHAYRGERDEALALYEAFRSSPPRRDEPSTFGVWDSFLAAMEGLALLGEHDEVAPHHDLALGAMATRMFRGWDYRLQQTVAGITATCRREWAEAESHFDHAIALARDVPMPLEVPEAQRFAAWMRLQREAAGDAAAARTLLQAAEQGYRAIGMPQHEALVARMLDQT